MITYGEERGSINKYNELKIHYMKESFWIKVIATNSDRTQVIGILMNSLLDSKKFVWGTMVIAKEINPNELCEMIKVIHRIPNNEKWGII
jgi:hypothetical protein